MEIIGSKLDLAFEELNIPATKTFNANDDSLQVWEIDDSEFNKLLIVSDDDWKVEYGWWRTGRSIYEGTADTEYTVNGNKMSGYTNDNVDEYSLDEYNYDSYSDWLSNVMSLSTEKNISIHAYSLASDNNMTLTEFMKTYQP